MISFKFVVHSAYTFITHFIVETFSIAKHITQI